MNSIYPDCFLINHILIYFYESKKVCRIMPADFSKRRCFRFAQQVFNVTERDERFILRIIQLVAKRLQTREQSDRRRSLQRWCRCMRLFQVIVRHTGALVMDVVEADVPRYPLQHSRQLVVRTPLNRRLDVIPLTLVFEI